MEVHLHYCTWWNKFISLTSQFFWFAFVCKAIDASFFVDLTKFNVLENILLLISTVIIVLLFDYGICNMLSVLDMLLFCFNSVIFYFGK